MSHIAVGNSVIVKEIPSNSLFDSKEHRFNKYKVVSVSESNRSVSVGDIVTIHTSAVSEFVDGLKRTETKKIASIVESSSSCEEQLN